MRHLFIDPNTEHNFKQAYHCLRNARKMHHHFSHDIQQIFSTLFYYVKFEHYPHYFFFKDDYNLKAGNLKGDFKLGSFSLTFDEGKVFTNKKTHVIYKPSLSSLIQPKKNLALSEEVFKNAKNTEILYEHFSNLLSNQATSESIEFFINHFWKDSVIVGFFFGYFSEQVIEKIIDKAPNLIMLPTQSEVSELLEPKHMYAKTYPTFQDKNRRYDRVYPDSTKNIFMTHYHEKPNLAFLMEKKELEKKVNSNLEQEKNAKKKSRKI
jgi:hypothetical protein